MHVAPESEPYVEESELGGKFWLAIVSAGIGIAIGCVLVLWLVSAAWIRWGGFGALLFFGGVLLCVGWIYDRRQAKKRGT